MKRRIIHSPAAQKSTPENRRNGLSCCNWTVGMNEPTTLSDKPDAHAAYAAHIALIELERSNPRLANNPFFQALRDSAYARFRLSFEAS